MTYYPQRTNTDCLVAATEFLLQKPREEFGVFLTYYHRKAGDFMSYAALANVLLAYDYRGEWLDAWTHGQIGLTNDRAILGVCFDGHPSLHACQWDGRRLWDAHLKAFVKGPIRVVYVLQDLYTNIYRSDPKVVLQTWHARIPEQEVLDKPVVPYDGPYWTIDLKDGA